MKVSVIICTYALDMYDHFQEAVESVLDQSYDDVEVVLVSDGDKSVYQQMHSDYGDRDNTVVSRTN